MFDEVHAYLTTLEKVQVLAFYHSPCDDGHASYALYKWAIMMGYTVAGYKFEPKTKLDDVFFDLDFQVGVHYHLAFLDTIPDDLLKCLNLLHAHGISFSVVVVDHHEGNQTKVDALRASTYTHFISFEPDSKMGATAQLVSECSDLTEDQRAFLMMVAAADMWNADYFPSILYYIFGRNLRNEARAHPMEPEEVWSVSFGGRELIRQCVSEGKAYYDEIVQKYASAYDSLCLHQVLVPTSGAVLSYNVALFPFLENRNHMAVLCVYLGTILPVGTTLVFWNEAESTSNGASLRFVNGTTGNLIPLANMWSGSGHKVACGFAKSRMRAYFATREASETNPYYDCLEDFGPNWEAYL